MMIVCSFPAVNPSKINGLTLIDLGVPSTPACCMLTERRVQILFVKFNEAVRCSAKAYSPAGHTDLSRKERVGRRYRERSRAGSVYPTSH